MNTEKQEKLSIFISHRHKDKHVADVFRETFEDWSNCAVNVFQSSNAENALMIGEKLDYSIKTAIVNSHVVLLIYTDQMADWTWCMYECGLAQDPETMDTRLVVFHTTEKPPSPLQHLVTVPLTNESIKTLTDNFHRDPKFFPRHTGAIAPGLDEDQIEERAQELYDALSRLIPEIKAIECHRYDSLTLGLDLVLMMKLKELDREVGYREAITRAKEIIKESTFIRRVVGEPHAHFNFESITLNMKFFDLVDRWKKESEYSDLEWQEELYDEMVRAVLNRKERSVSLPFNSLESDINLWFLPVLSHFRIIPSEKCAEFDVLLCGIQPKAAHRMIEKA